MKFKHSTLAALSGVVWLVIGFFLMKLGLTLLITAVDHHALKIHSQPFIQFFSHYFGTPEQAVLLIIVLGLLAGYLKSRYVLSKSVKKGVDHIQSQPNPASLGSIYTARYYILIGAMVLLGFSIKYFGLANDIRGFVDVAIGAALINGAMTYFRYARKLSEGTKGT